MIRSVLTPGRSVLAGGAVLMACACGAAANGAKLLSVAGIGATGRTVLPLFTALGALLLLSGLWRKGRALLLAAGGGFVLLALAAALTPPMAMSGKAQPWNLTQISGGFLYLAAAALIGFAIWRAFPTANPKASATAIGGTALATGCTCCMITGAAAGLLVAAGGTTGMFLATPLVFLSGLAVAAAGLFALAGWRPVLFVAAGGVVTSLGPGLLRQTGDWMWQGVNLRFIPGYLVYLAGAALVLQGFAFAYSVAKKQDPAPAMSEAEPATA